VRENESKDQDFIICYPNPFRNQISLEYELPSASKVTIILADLHGRELMVLEKGYQAQGTYTCEMETSSLAKGVYLLKILADERGKARKIVKF